MRTNECNSSCTALIIGFNRTEYSANEDDGNMTLTVHVRGETTQCEEGEWMVHFSTTASTAQSRI